MKERLGGWQNWEERRDWETGAEAGEEEEEEEGQMEEVKGKEANKTLSSFL